MCQLLYVTLVTQLKREVETVCEAWHYFSSAEEENSCLTVSD